MWQVEEGGGEDGLKGEVEVLLRRCYPAFKDRVDSRTV